MAIHNNRYSQQRRFEYPDDDDNISDSLKAHRNQIRRKSELTGDRPKRLADFFAPKTNPVSAKRKVESGLDGDDAFPEAPLRGRTGRAVSFEDEDDLDFENEGGDGFEGEGEEVYENEGGDGFEDEDDLDYEDEGGHDFEDEGIDDSFDEPDNDVFSESAESRRNDTGRFREFFQKQTRHEPDFYEKKANAALAAGDYEAALDAWTDSFIKSKNINSIKRIGEFFYVIFVQGYQETGYDGQNQETNKMIEVIIGMFLVYVIMGGDQKDIEGYLENAASLFHVPEQFARIGVKVRKELLSDPAAINQFIRDFHNR